MARIQTQWGKSQTQQAETQFANRDEIAKVAYELYLKRGCKDGHDLEDWLKAEVIVRNRRSSR